MKNVDASVKIIIYIYIYICEKDYVWNPSTCSYENGKKLESIMDDSAIICDEVIRWKYKNHSNKF